MEKQLYIKQLRPWLYLMDEAHEATGYLVIGEDRACVIDTMNGYCDLSAFVRSVTDKPVIVVNTHGHPDHIYGNIYFDNALLHPDDLPLAAGFVDDPEFVAFCKEKRRSIPPWRKRGRLPGLRGKEDRTALLSAPPVSDAASHGVDEETGKRARAPVTRPRNKAGKISFQRKHTMDYLENYYSSYREDERLTVRHGQVEYLTTMKYIREALNNDKKKNVLEVGAGTGRYSVALAREGYPVTAVELIRHNIEILRSKLSGDEPITVTQGNAMDLSFLADNSYDLTLLLGPMYHLYTREDKVKALTEAVRVTKPGGTIMVAYCMNEPTVVMYVFGLNRLQELLDKHMLTEDWHCISEPKDLFELIRTEEIADLDSELAVRRVKLVATDGATNYMRELIDGMDQETFDKWMDYHLSICERQDLIGASHHTLDILRKL